MRVTELNVHNYKSLRNIRLKLAPLATFLGANASGKSNFSDALDFLGEVYRWSLEGAVSKMGGYENICYRHVRRSKQAITFAVKVQFSREELGPRGFIFQVDGEIASVSFEHSFSFKAAGQKIAAPFEVVQENVKLIAELPPKKGGKITVLECRRRGRILEYLDVATGQGPSFESLALFVPSQRKDELQQYIEGLLKEAPTTELLSSILPRVLYGFQYYTRSLGAVGVYQLNPRSCRGTGVPLPNPTLTRFGENLPAVLKYLQEKHRKQYQQLFKALRRVMPTLEAIKVPYNPNRTLSLAFEEKGFGRPWIPEDISDGTIQTLALLVAVFDPRTKLVTIEEPENSVHPWALRNFVGAVREVVQDKQILLTTHSSILIDQMKPEEVWIVSRPQAATRIESLVEIDPEISSMVESGEIGLAEYLDSGAVEAYVPEAGV